MTAVGDPVRVPSRWRSRLTTLRDLSWSQRGLLLEAVCVMTIVVLALKVASLRRVQRVLAGSGRHRGSRPASPDEMVSVLDIARLVNVASRHTPLASTCLPRSLTLWWLLGRRGFNSEIRFGARKVSGSFEAHAWVEHEGVVVGDDRDAVSEYVPMPGLAVDGRA